MGAYHDCNARAIVRLSRGLTTMLALCAISGARAQFVTFDIVAEGSRHEAVTDLRANEIQILDERRSQTPVFFHSNQQRPGSPRATVVVFDLSYYRLQGIAWNETVETMRRFEMSGFLYFYVVTARGALLPVHGLPAADADAAPANQPWIDLNLPPLEKALPLEPIGGTSGMIGVSPYLELSMRLMAFPGRKSLVCIGCLLAAAADWQGGADPARMERAAGLRQLSDAFREARVGVYVVGGQAASGIVGTPLTLPKPVAGFAEATGGRVYTYGQAADAIEQAVRDGQSSYRVAYLPPVENWDGRQHKISVASLRRGVRLLAPGRYIADRVEREPAVPDAAVTSPFDQTDIGVSVASETKLEKTLRIEVRVDAADLLLARRNDRRRGAIVMQAICYTADARRRACTQPAEARLDLDKQQYAVAMRGGLRLPFELQADAASGRIRIVVHDENSGLTGSVTVPAREEE